MSLLLETLLTDEQRAEAARNDCISEAAHMAGPCPHLGRGLAPGADGNIRSWDESEGSLRGLTNADIARVIRGEPYTWAGVPWRTDKPARRRDEPRASRWGDCHHG